MATQLEIHAMTMSLYLASWISPIPAELVTRAEQPLVALALESVPDNAKWASTAADRPKRLTAAHK